MATNLLSAGTDAASSSEFTLASGESTSIVIRETVVVSLLIEQKDEAGAFTQIYELKSGSAVLSGPGTFRVRRPANSKSFGAFRG
jgi:hypothetical protein